MKIIDLFPVIGSFEIIQIKFLKENLLTTYLTKTDNFYEILKYANYDIISINTKRIIDDLRHKDLAAFKIDVESLDQS